MCHAANTTAQVFGTKATGTQNSASEAKNKRQISQHVRTLPPSASTSVLDGESSSLIDQVQPQSLPLQLTRTIFGQQHGQQLQLTRRPNNPTIESQKQLDDPDQEQPQQSEVIL